MKIGDSEYEKLLDAFLKEELDKANPKPNGMYGRWAWDSAKKREFKAYMKAKGLLEE